MRVGSRPSARAQALRLSFPVTLSGRGGVSSGCALSLSLSHPRPAAAARNRSIPRAVPTVVVYARARLPLSTSVVAAGYRLFSRAYFFNEPAWIKPCLFISCCCCCADTWRNIFIFELLCVELKRSKGDSKSSNVNVIVNDSPIVELRVVSFAAEKPFSFIMNFSEYKLCSWQNFSLKF